MKAFKPNPKYWALLQTKSRRALMRKRKYNGRDYFYNPRSELLCRLSEKLGESIEDVYQGLQSIRNHWLESQGL